MSCLCSIMQPYRITEDQWFDLCNNTTTNPTTITNPTTTTNPTTITNSTSSKNSLSIIFCTKI